MTRALLSLMLFTLIAGSVSCGSEGSFSPTVTLLRPDGEAMELSASPIPIGARVQLTFAQAIAQEADRATVESQVRILAPDSTSVPGAFTWNDVFTQLTFKPTRRLSYGSTYTLQTGPATEAAASAVKSSVTPGDTTFMTMLRGDLNGDGYADLVMAAPQGAVGGIAKVGITYIYYGAADGVPTTPSLSLPGTGDTEDLFGQGHTTADLNGDGFDDLVVGEPGRNHFDGAAYVYNGSAAGIPATPDLALAGTAAAEDALGQAVANIGDANGDGFDDLAIGAPRHDPGSLTGAGALFAYYGSAAGIATTADVTIPGTTASEDLGTWVASGDFNGDGYDDLAGCATGHDGGRGAAYIYPGSENGIVTDAASVTTLTGPDADGYFGFPAASGDVNGDGYDDLAVGSIAWANFVGATYIYQGSDTGLPTTHSSRLVGNNQIDAFGFVAPAGDVNGDGFVDLLIGAPAAVADAKDGLAYVFDGSASGMAQTPSTTWSGSAAEGLGFTYPSLDLNGDGYLDAIVAAPWFDANRGRISIYYGDGTSFGTTPVVIGGEAAGDFFGDYMPPS